jgi:hypothetical protein
MKTAIDKKEFAKLAQDEHRQGDASIGVLLNSEINDTNDNEEHVLYNTESLHLQEHQGDASISDPGKEEFAKLLDERISRAKLEIVSEMKNTSEDKEHTLYNTESFHLQAVVALTTDYSTAREYNQCLQKWIMPLASVLLAMIQLLVLFWLIYEASFPTCSRHDDCNIGEYCDNLIKWEYSDTYTAPRCNSCAYMYYEPSSTSSCESYEDTNKDVLVWISKDGNYHPSSLNNSTAINCLVKLHCDGTDTGTDNCDYLDLNFDKITWSNRIVFFFVAILFSGSLYKDIKESMVEEALLNHAMAKTVGTHQNRAQENSTQLLAWIIRLTLRMRIFVLPWVIAAASTTIIVVESLSAKNIILNLLAIGFIAEADNVFGLIFLSDSQKSRANDFVDQSKKEVNKDDVNISPLWLCILAILPTVIMVVAVLNMVEFLNLFSYGDVSQCIVSGPVFRGICMTCPLVMVMISGVKHFFQDKNYSVSKRFISTSNQICQNSIPVYLSIILDTIAWLITIDVGVDLKVTVYILAFFSFSAIIGHVQSCIMESDRFICIGVLLSFVYVTAFISVSTILVKIYV